MADYTFYTNPMSRGQIARWALHEVEADYDQELVDWSAKSADFLAANPMGKVPTLIHHANEGPRVVSEAAAVCLYLAEMHPEAELLPDDTQMADYYRWTFFCAGPVDQALTAKALGFGPSDARQEGLVSFGNFERLIATLDHLLEDRMWVCGERFTMADVYVGSSIDWGLNFGLLPPNESFVAYTERCQARSAYKEAKAIDGALIAKSDKA
ncbi:MULTISPECIES: glutathione S-transferase family protein [Novosphingobium]|uniref:Glutathione S-transferase family protein n=1 Tax=Novosphingobium decolorationis TaxID=2698673 RepID=A0ABX8E187_9SPHN|nr:MULTISPECIES: glutathione S-transferase family protein [Novosphingobium]MED5545584.1 glutathione S-transferase family protein [Pseudomonadota bacterium]QVM82899.1 glutathione S-transferase family protein [Novosphingobium decolorationis]GAM06413.1 glutathione S-transferase [Novosphingobium sp. MBES04]